ncbi:MAG: hypothetical protein WC645_03940 [Candidatus Margulisiibacteriota bacterium]
MSPLALDGLSRPLRPSIKLGRGPNRVPDLITNHQHHHPDRLVFVTQVIDRRLGPMTGFQIRSGFYPLEKLYPYGWDRRMECKPVSELAADILEREFPNGVRWEPYQGRDSIIARSFEGKEVVLLGNTDLEEAAEYLPPALEQLRASTETARTAVLCVCDPNEGHRDYAERHSPLLVYAHLPPLSVPDPAKNVALVFARALQNII